MAIIKTFQSMHIYLPGIYGHPRPMHFRFQMAMSKLLWPETYRESDQQFMKRMNKLKKVV